MACRADFRACVAAVVNTTEATQTITESDFHSDAVERAGIAAETAQQRATALVSLPAPGFRANTTVKFRPLEMMRKGVGVAAAPSIDLNCSRFFYDGRDSMRVALDTASFPAVNCLKQKRRKKTERATSPLCSSEGLHDYDMVLWI